MKKNVLESGLKKAREITRINAKTFYFASRFLPRRKMYAAYSVYSICRISDDSVDNASGDNRQSLELIKNKINDAYKPNLSEDPLLAAFKKTATDYKIPKIYFDELIKGMYADLEKMRYLNFSELYDYCYKVAGVVGLIMLRIFGHKNKDAEKYAVSLGIAMQLTNIIRDIQEDFLMGRIYLPQEDLKRFNVTEKQIADLKLDKNLINLLKFYIGRAREYYCHADKGIKLITNRRSRFVVCAMSRIYAGILTEVEKNGYNIFSQRARVNTGRKITLLLKILIERKYL